jgi:site-specific recombinase XerD
MALEFTICELRWERYPRVSENTHARQWLEFQAARGLAANTLDAYGRNLDRYVRFLEAATISLEVVNRSTLACYLRSIAERPTPRTLKDGQEVRATLSNATLQQHLTVIRLFHDYLVEENVCTRNPLRSATNRRSLIPSQHRLPWIPSEEQWHAILRACKRETLRNRVMFAMSYDAALRREEICSLQTSDIDPAHRLIRIRVEATKNRRERIVPYAEATGELFSRYLAERRKLSRDRGALFLSESLRNKGKPISIWTWTKTVGRMARECNVPKFTPHTLRHLCLTDLARSDWDIHEIATFAGHRSIQTTTLYIHLSGRELADKLARGMAEIHARRVVAMREELGC